MVSAFDPATLRPFGMTVSAKDGDAMTILYDDCDVVSLGGRTDWILKEPVRIETLHDFGGLRASRRSV